MHPSVSTTNLSTAASKQDISLTELWLIVRKRRLMLIGIACGVGMLAATYGVIKGKQYTATGEIQIQPGSAAELKQSASADMAVGAFNTLDIIIESDSRILTSEKLLVTVARTLKLQSNPEFFGARQNTPADKLVTTKLPLLNGNLDDPYVRAAIVNILRSHLTIARIPRTRMLQISYVSSSPQLSEDIVNALESEFIKNNFIAHYSSTQEVTNWLTGQIDDLRTVVQQSQDKMVDLQKKLGISALDPGHSLIVQDMASLEKNASDATEQRVIAEARYRILQSLPSDQVQDAPTPALSDGGPSLLSSLRSQRASTAAELAKLQPVYGPNYPQVKQLNSQLQSQDREIAKQQQSVLRQAQDASRMAEETESKAKAILDAKSEELYGQRDAQEQYELLSQEYESNRHMYESILARLREAAVDAGLDSADISVVDLASLPIAPSSTSPKTLGLIGFIFGGIGGLAIALLVEKLDTRMRDSKHIQEFLGLPALAILPQTNWKSKESDEDRGSGPEILWDARSSFSEAIRVLRTSMQLSSTSRQSRVIAVTSCQPGEGKSTVSTNLAAALAQGGKKVILVDTDMRRPSVYWRLGLSVKKGLSEYLTGNESLDGVIQTHQTLTTLDLIPSGISPPLPADLLGSDQMKQLAATLREHYEYVIFDTPPALSVTDPLIVSTLADGLVLVVRQGFCTRAMLHRATEIFREVDVKVYGFVLNGVDASLPEYYGYLGYYSYDYKN